MTIRFLDAARDDLHDAIYYYEAQSQGLGAQFRDEIRATLERIEQFPEAWRQIRADIRRCRTHRFPYGVIYQLRPDEILVIAVAHLHRRPGYWRGRLFGR